MNIDTVRFSHLLEVNGLNDLNYFLSHTAFVVSHKSESIETLLGVLWYLPVNSPIIIVTNCPEQERETIERGLTERLTHHTKTYVIHQKDERIAALFNAWNVQQILGPDGKVINGKGEGMYIGTLCAMLLGYPQWIIFYDADNFVPSALLEYTLAMSRLFMSARSNNLRLEEMTDVDTRCTAPALHNVRICWSSKPELGQASLDVKLLGRCTRVVSPLFTTLLKGWFGIADYPFYSSNAGEQGMTMQTAKALGFSSGYSVETYQLLHFLYQATLRKHEPNSAILQQYQSRSPHFHDKRDDAHIRKMIADSLGGFLLFKKVLPREVKQHLRQVYTDLHLEVRYPTIYPPLQSLQLEGGRDFAERYRLFKSEDEMPESRFLVPEELAASDQFTTSQEVA